MKINVCFRCAALVLIVLVELVSGCRFGENLRQDRPRLAAGVVMRDVTFYSAALGREMPYRVLLPEMRAGRKFPVVYLLHGNGGDFHDWSNQSDVAQYAARGLILVMPEGHSSYFLNAAEKPKDRYEDYLVHDLTADVEARFPAQRNRTGRALVGVSMGGFAAAKIAFSHPDEYVFVGALSPPIDVPKRKFTWKRAGQWWGFRSIFGPMDSPERKDRDPFELAKLADTRAIPYIYLTAGEQEPLLEPDRRFAARLQQRGFAFSFHTMPGGHDWGEWDRQIPGCFAGLFHFMAVGTV